MKCVIPGTNVKVFGKAVHSLSKIGDELYIEPLEHGLALRTVNSSRSAYACFVFAPSFFTHYNDGSGTVDTDDSEEQTVKCKIGMKSCLTVFKSLSTLEKTVDRCKITLDMEAARLIFQLSCRHGILKTHNLSFIECETLQAVFSKDLCPNVLLAQARLLSDAVANFQMTQEEVSVIVDPQEVTFKNYTDDEPDPTKVIHTRLSLKSDEFDSMQIGVDTEVTFCLKELRAILAFSETANLPISIRFESAGKPIVFSLDSDPTFEANFVLATLADPVSTASQVSCSQQSSYNIQNRPTPSTARRFQKKTTGVSRTRPPAANPRTSTTTSNGYNVDTATTTEVSHRKTKSSASERMNAVYQELLTDDMDFPDHETTQKPSESTNHRTEDNRHRTTSPANQNSQDREPQASASRDSRELSASPVIAFQSRPKQLTTSFLPVSDDDDDDDDENETMVPGTPPSKKFKLSFFGMSQSTTSGSQREPPAVVLAADTDDEDD